jgi:hypothetical protein
MKIELTSMCTLERQLGFQLAHSRDGKWDRQSGRALYCMLEVLSVRAQWERGGL